MNKVLVEIFSQYDNGFEQLLETDVIDDTSQNRKRLVLGQIINPIQFKTTDCIDDFISQNSNKVRVDFDSSDCDSPYAHKICISTYSDKMDELYKNYKQDVETVKKVFNQ